LIHKIKDPKGAMKNGAMERKNGEARSQNSEAKAGSQKIRK